MNDFQFTKKKIIGSLLLIGLFLLIIQLGWIVDSNKTGQFVIKQTAISGNMDVIFTEGMFWQLWADLWRWPNSDQFSFSHRIDQGKKYDESVNITFKNGSKGNVSGSVRIEYPIGDKMGIINLKRNYGSHAGVMSELIAPQIYSLLNMTAMLMTPEAAITQKGLYQQMFIEQLKNGMYVTKPAKEKFVDPITQEVTWKDVVEIDKDEFGKPKFMPNTLSLWKIKIDNIAIESIEPDPKTTEMIGKRRDSEMSIMVAKAQVEQANQDKLRVEAEGIKNAAEAKYKAEVVKSQAIVNAQRDKEVAVIQEQQKAEMAFQKLKAAEIDRKTAEQEKLAAIERATGQAESRKKLIDADNALELKGNLWLESQKVWADAYAHRNVPSIIMGSSDEKIQNDTANFMNMMTIKAAKDLGADLSIIKK